MKRTIIFGLVFLLFISFATAGLNDDANLQYWYTCDNTMKDSSPNGLDGTEHFGSETYAYTGVFGNGSCDFDGWGLTNNLDVNSDDFTLTMFIRKPSNAASILDIWYHSIGDAGNQAWLRYEGGSTLLKGILYDGAAGNSLSTADDYDDDNWYFLVYMRDSTNVSIEVRDSTTCTKQELVNLPSETVRDATDTTNENIFGGRSAATDYEGWIDEIRYYDRTLSKTEMDNLCNYNDDIKNITHDMVAYYSWDSDCTTDDWASYDLTGANSPTATATSLLGGGACDFDQADGDYLHNNNIAALDIATSGFTICNWAKADDNAASMMWGISETGVGKYVYGNWVGGADERWQPFAYDGAGSNAYYGTDYTGDTSWHFYCTSLGANGEIVGYEDGVLTGWDESPTLNMDTVDDAFRIGDLFGGTLWNGQMDEFGIWADNLGEQQINLLYNGGSGYNPTTIEGGGGGTDPAVVTSTDLTADDNIGFLDYPIGDLPFNVSASITNTSNIFDILLYVNGTLNKSYYSQDLSSAIAVNLSFTGIEAAWNITTVLNQTNATDSDGTDLYVDGVNPAYSLDVGNNTICWIKFNTDEVNFTHTAADTNLFAVNYTILNLTGTNMYNYSNNSLTGITTDIKNWSINMTGWALGRYELRAEVWDSHTKKEINPDDFHINYLNNGVNIDDLLIYGDEVNSTLVYFDENQPDRNKIKIKFDTDALQHSVWIEDSEELTYIPEEADGYMGHFVNWRMKRWVDFESPDVESVDVYPDMNTDNKYLLVFNMYSEVDEIEFESIGELNVYNASYFFNITDSFYVTAIDTITNTSITSFSVDVYNSSENHSYSTTDGTAEINITSGNWTINLTATNYIVNTTTVNITSGGSFQFNLTLEKSLYFFVYDEWTNELIDDRNVTIDVVNYENSSFTYTTDTGSTFQSGFAAGDYEIRYRADGYQPRLYFTSISGQDTQTLNLYLLNTSLGEIKLIEVQDDSGNSISNVTVKMLKHFVSSNQFSVVEMTKTDESGNAFVFGNQYETPYKFILDYGGVTRLTTDVVRLDTRTLYFKLNLLTTGLDNYWEMIGASTELDFNSTTDIWTYTWSSGSTSVESGNLVVIQQTLTGETTLVNQTTAGSTGTITYNMSSYNGVSGVYVGTAGVIYNSEYLALERESYDYDDTYINFGMSGILLSILLILVITSFGAYNPSISIGLMLFGLIVTVTLGMVELSITWLAGLVFVGILYMYVLKT